MKRYPKYKDSGIEWIGEIPGHWNLKRLKFLSAITTGESDTIDREDNGKYPFFVRAQTVERINTYSYDGEAVLTAGDGVGVGRVFHYINGKFDYHQRVYKISDFKEIVGKYFFYYMKENFHKEVMKISAKSTVDSLRLPMFLDFPVAFGGIKEQQSIADFLDHKTHQIDTLIEKKQKQIELLKEQRTAIINHAVTKGLNPDVKMKDSGIEWLGEIPVHWEVKRLKFVSQINPTKNTSLISKDSDELVTFLPMERVFEDGTFDILEKKPVKELWNGFTYFEDEDVIVAKITPCFENGKGAYLKNLGSRIGFGSTEFHVLRAIQGITTPKFLYYIIHSPMFMTIGEAFMFGAAGQKRVPKDFIEDFNIGLPSIEEQLIIIDFIDEQTNEMDILIKQHGKSIELLQEYRTTLISNAVTGKIDVRDEVPQ